MYDSCSVIHFKTSSITSVNDGCTEVAKEVSRILKPGGYFIVASDILHPNHENPAHPNYSVGEFLFFKQLANVFITRTLHSYGGFDFNFDDDFNTNILQVNKSLPNYNRLNHTFYQGKQDWKTFCHYEEYCHSNLAIGRLVFRKDTL